MTSDKTRKQILNQADCFEKIRRMVWDAAKKPHEPSAEDIQLMEHRFVDYPNNFRRMGAAHIVTLLIWFGMYTYYIIYNTIHVQYTSYHNYDISITDNYLPLGYKSGVLKLMLKLSLETG